MLASVWLLSKLAKLIKCLFELQSKKRHFNSLNVNDVTENKKLWKTIKHFFTEKNKTTNNIILSENNQTVREDKAICQIFNTYFTNVTKGLKLRQVDESQSFENK